MRRWRISVPALGFGCEGLEVEPASSSFHVIGSLGFNFHAINQDGLFAIVGINE